MTIQRHLRQAVKMAINYRGQRRDTARGYVFDLLGRSAEYVGVTGTSGSILVPTGDLVGKLTFVSRGFSEATMDRILAIVDEMCPAPRTTFVDVGANIGTSTLAALNKHGFQRAVAVEPSPVNLRLLRANVALNELEARVEVVAAAASAAAGTPELELSQDNTGDNRIRYTDDAGRFDEHLRTTTTVRVIALDDLQLDDVGLIWMDTQGHEGHVLAGAHATVSRGVVVVSEYWPYGLRRAEGFDLFHDEVAAHFSTVVDATTARSYPAADCRGLEEQYPNAAHTDLVLVP